MNNIISNSIYQEYINSLLERSLSIDPNQEAFLNYVEAFYQLLSTQVLSEDLIIKTANKINENSIYISNGYRKVGEYTLDSKISICPPDKIHDSIIKLIDNYQNIWNSTDILEKEAKFHIEFIRIHPFEDGNKRTARLLLIYNLLLQNQIPFTITEDLYDFYNFYLKEENIEGMKNLFQIQTKKEKEFINQLLLQKTSTKKKGKL